MSAQASKAGPTPRRARPYCYPGSMNPMPLIRTAVPADYDAIVRQLDAWWGRPVAASLPRLFLDLFWATSLVIEGTAGPDAFLIGVLSPSDDRQAYIHFVGVAPRARRRGYARALYEEFFRRAQAAGRTTVAAVTAPVNQRSAQFHQALGFTVTGPVPDYNGPGRDMLTFRKELPAAGPAS